jgi:hypothetical protein
MTRGWLSAFINLAHLLELKLSRRELIWEFGALRELGIMGIKNPPTDNFGAFAVSVPVDPVLHKPAVRFWDKICLRICCVRVTWLGWAK